MRARRVDFVGPLHDICSWQAYVRNELARAPFHECIYMYISVKTSRIHEFSLKAGRNSILASREIEKHSLCINNTL